MWEFHQIYCYHQKDKTKQFSTKSDGLRVQGRWEGKWSASYFERHTLKKRENPFSKRPTRKKRENMVWRYFERADIWARALSVRWSHHWHIKGFMAIESTVLVRSPQSCIDCAGHKCRGHYSNELQGTSHTLECLKAVSTVRDHVWGPVRKTPSDGLIHKSLFFCVIKSLGGMTSAGALKCHQESPLQLSLLHPMHTPFIFPVTSCYNDQLVPVLKLKVTHPRNLLSLW